MDKQERVESKTDEIMSGYGGLDEATTKMLSDMVRQYAWYVVSCDMLTEQIDREGMLVDGKENPALAVLHKTSSRMHEFFGKIATVARRAQADETDGMMSFIAGGQNG